MERGPRGLPSFPPDWSGSKNTAGNWKGAPSGGGSGTSISGGGSDSGSRGSSSSSSSAPNAAAANAAAKQKAADESARQAAETKNASTAARNSALAQDARKSGIGSINVGPTQAPVRIGSGNISQAVSQAAQPTTPVQRTVSPVNSVSPPVPTAKPSNLGSPNVKAQIAEGIMGVATRLGIDPVDLGTAISYETAGTFNPLKEGPTTKWGTHRGLIQFGEPQAQQYGVDWKNPVESQLGPGGAVESYLKTAGVKPGMGMMDVYSAINAGRVGLYNRSDVAAGGAPGTVADKVNQQMSGHRRKAESLLSSYTASAAPPSTSSPVAVQDAAAGAVFGALRNIPSALSNFKIPSIPEQSSLVKMMPDSVKIAYANKMAEDFSKKIPGAIESGLGALDRMVNRPVPSATVPVAGKMYQDRLVSSPQGETIQVNPQDIASLDPADRAAFEASQQMQRYSPNRAGVSTSVTPEQQRRLDMQNQYMGVEAPGFNQPQNYETPQETLDKLAGVYDQYGIGRERDDYKLAEAPQDYPKYVSPEVQQAVEDQEKTNRRGLSVIKRGMPFFGGIASGIEKIQEQFTDKDIADYGTDLKYKYLQSTPDQKAAMRAKYPDIRRFAVSIGEIAPNTGTQYAGGIPTQEPGGKGNDVGRSTTYQTAAAPYSGPVEAQEMGRPSQYYLWDLGVGVPSPGDPEYNDYQKYLRERGASAEV